MFKIFAVIMAIANGGPQPTGVELGFRHVAFSDEASCKAFLADDAFKDAKDQLTEALATKSKEDGVTYDVQFVCHGIPDEGDI